MQYTVQNIDKTITQNFDTYEEAYAYVLKLGDQNILAKITDPRELTEDEIETLKSIEEELSWVEA